MLKMGGASGETLLHVAAMYGRQHIIDFLLHVGADINAVDAHGMTPLHYAVKEKQDWLNLHMFGRPQRQMQPFAVCQYLVSLKQTRLIQLISVVRQ